MNNSRAFKPADTAHCTGDYSSFITLVAGSVKRSFEPYWFALGIENEVANFLRGNGDAIT